MKDDELRALAVTGDNLMRVMLSAIVGSKALDQPLPTIVKQLSAMVDKAPTTDTLNDPNLLARMEQAIKRKLTPAQNYHTVAGALALAIYDQEKA